jgi:hypothetical protein
MATSEKQKTTSPLQLKYTVTLKNLAARIQSRNTSVLKREGRVLPVTFIMIFTELFQRNKKCQGKVFYRDMGRELVYSRTQCPEVRGNRPTNTTHYDRTRTSF